MRQRQLGRSRQGVVSRAKKHVVADEARFDADREQAARLTQRFTDAAGEGNLAGMLAVQQKRSADESSVAATDAETTAVARQAGAAALVSDDIDESLLLALSGVALHDSPDTRSSLLAAMGRNPRLIASTPLR